MEDLAFVIRERIALSIPDVSSRLRAKVEAAIQLTLVIVIVGAVLAVTWLPFQR